MSRAVHITAVILALYLDATGLAADRPNILLAISDDQSFAHTSAAGDPVVFTPEFDRVALRGVMFPNAYVAASSCTPSRGAILTGQQIWRLEEGGNLWSSLPARFALYTDLLEAAGYFVGHERKGWGPPNHPDPEGKRRNPAGPKFASFDAFVKQRPDGAPFCYWMGTSDPHRPFEEGSGVASGKRLQHVAPPHFLPDLPQVRSDILDYYMEIERFDRDLGRVITAIAQAGELDDTIVIVTSDNGFPFPRGKANLYDYGVRVPLAIMWPARVRGGRTITDMVSLTDLAPTILQAAGLPTPAEMTGRSLLPLLLSEKTGRVDPSRDFVVSARERHAMCRADRGGYPSRAIHTHDFLYIINFEPDRWPVGDPDPFYNTTGIPGRMGRRAQGFADIDPSPTKHFMLDNEDRHADLFALSFGKRPAEELYDTRHDRYQLTNVADDPRFAEIKQQLRQRLLEYLKETGDPRVTGAPALWDTYPFYGRTTPHEQAQRKQDSAKP